MSRANRRGRKASYEDGQSWTSPKEQTFTLYKYITHTTLEHIIRQWKMKLSTYADVNDPFEFLAKGETKHGQVMRDFPFLCLSETGSSPAMWGYYAEAHHGAILEFSIKARAIRQMYTNGQIAHEGIRMKNGTFIWKVNYSDERVDVKKFKISNILTAYQNILLAKSSDWQCEREYRITDFDTPLDEADASGFRYTELLMPHLSRIILGISNHKAPEEVRLLMDEHNRPSNIKVTRARINPDLYKVSF